MTSTPTARITLPCKTVKRNSQNAKILNLVQFMQQQMSAKVENNHLLGTTDVTWKPILTTIPEVRCAAYSAKVACVYHQPYHINVKR